MLDRDHMMTKKAKQCTSNYLVVIMHLTATELWHTIPDAVVQLNQQ